MDKAHLDILGQTSQFMHCEVQIAGKNFNCTFVYESNQETERETLWNGLVDIAANKSLPWIVMGDFNAILGNDDRMGGMDGFGSSTEAFNHCVNHCCLSDLNYFGCKFTWTNNQMGNARVWRRLDRALVDTNWLSLFSNSNCQVLEAGISDHSPLVVDVKLSSQGGP